MYHVQTTRVAIILKKKKLNFASVNSMIFLRLSLNIAAYVAFRKNVPGHWSTDLLLLNEVPTLLYSKRH